MSEPMRMMWRWRVYDDVTKKRVITRHHMDEATAKARYQDAEKVEWTRMDVRDLGGTTGVLQPPRSS